MFDDEQGEGPVDGDPVDGDGAVPEGRDDAVGRDGAGTGPGGREGAPGDDATAGPDGADDQTDAQDDDAGEDATDASREPGGLAGVLEEMAALVGLPLAVGLAEIDPDGQDPADLVELAAQWSRVLAWAHYQRAEVLAALVAGAIEHDAAAGALTAVSTEVAMRQGISRPAATRLVR
ncbi:hypothetical protein GB883_20195, partial [Georgenia thermotolerans]